MQFFVIVLLLGVAVFFHSFEIFFFTLMDWNQYLFYFLKRNAKIKTYQEIVVVNLEILPHKLRYAEASSSVERHSLHAQRFLLL